jgi:hypothetical protein
MVNFSGVNEEVSEVENKAPGVDEEVSGVD